MEWIYKYVSWAAIISGIGFLIKYLIQKKIDSYFGKKLEDHKQELAIITEKAKYDISRKLFDFEAYASKKHIVYPELYSIMFELGSEMSKFRFKFDIDTESSKKDLDNSELRSLFFEKIGPTVDRIPKAQDYFYKNELYLSKSTAAAYDEAMTTQLDCINKIVMSFLKNIKDDDWQDPSFCLINISEEDLEKAEEKIRILKETIYKELSYTHAEEITEKEKALS